MKPAELGDVTRMDGKEQLIIFAADKSHLGWVFAVQAGIGLQGRRVR
jgi:hypothetical protein